MNLNVDQWWNNDKCWSECKKRLVCEKGYTWKLATYSCENGKYLASIMNNSTITCDEIIESYDKDAHADEEATSYDEAKLYDKTRTIPTNFNEKKATYKTQNFYILLAFLLITAALLIAVSIYCFLIKNRPKRKRLLPFYETSNGLGTIHWWHPWKMSNFSTPPPSHLLDVINVWPLKGNYN